MSSSRTLSCSAGANRYGARVTGAAPGTNDLISSSHLFPLIQVQEKNTRKIHGVGVSTEYANQKFLRSLPASWSQSPLEPDVKGSTDHPSSALTVACKLHKGKASHHTLMNHVLFSLLTIQVSTIGFMRILNRATLLESADQKEIKKAEGEMQGTLDIKQKTMGGDLENRRNLKICNSRSDTEVTSCSKECEESYAW
ncbi:hypothetical protein Tco_0901325 [Tanacetum coccineum]